MSEPTKPPYKWERPTIDWPAHLKTVKDAWDKVKPSWDMDIFAAEAGCGSLDDLPHFSHPTVIIAPKDSPAGGAIIGSLFGNTKGHTALLVVHNPGTATGMTVVMQNEVTIRSGNQIPLLFGSAQKACALAVNFCIAVGILPKDRETRDSLVVGIQVYLDEKATDPERVMDNCTVAVVQAIVNAVIGGTCPDEAFKACGDKHVFADVQPMAAPDLTALKEFMPA